MATTKDAGREAEYSCHYLLKTAYPALPHISLMNPPPPQEPVCEIARQRVENAVRHLLEGLRCSPDPAVHHAAAEVAARLELPVLCSSALEQGRSAEVD
jgi:hypothetical protein